jgi:hypothetical protein
MTVTTYLSQEGFEEQKKGKFFSREINTSVTSTASPKLWDVTVNEFTYKDIMDADLPKVVEAIHKFTGTALVVTLYNLQREVLMKRIYPIKEAI